MTIHAELAERWPTFSLARQLAYVGSEVQRAIAAGEGGAQRGRANRFEHALATSEAMGARPFAVATCCELGATLAARDQPGDAERAAALLHQAEEEAEELGMGRVRRRAARCAQALVSPSE